MRLTIVTGFFLPVPPIRGGSSEKIWHRLAGEFAAQGHEVTFISRAWPGMADQETVDGVRHIRIPGADHRASLAANLWLDFRWGIRVARVLPPADVVICNTVSLPAWLRRFKPSAGRVAAVIARMPKGHGRFYGNVDLLLSLSESVTQALVRENPRLGDRIRAFPYPIDWTLHARAAAARPGRRPAVATLGFVGRIHPEKGIALLLRAAVALQRRNLPPWRVELTGPTAIEQGGGGPAFVEALEREFRGPLGDQLVFSGAEFDPEKLAQRFAGIDVFCYPSVAEHGETFGVAIAEAMAARCVPVVSALECFRGLVTLDTGVVFDHRAENGAERLADALARLLVDPATCHALASRAQEHVRQYDFHAVAKHLLETLSAGSAAPAAAQNQR